MAFFDPYPEAFGGSHRVILTLADELVRREWDVSIISAGRGRIEEAADARGIPVIPVNVPRRLMLFGHRLKGWRGARGAMAMPLAWWRFARLFDHRFDIVHVNDLRGVLLAGPAARLLGIPVVWHVHIVEPLPLLNRIGSWLAQAVLVPSRSFASEVTGVRPNRICVLANCVPQGLLGLARDETAERLVVSVARVTPQKGLDILLRGMAIVVMELPDAKLLIYGESQEGYTAYSQTITALVSELGLVGCVEFVNHLREPHAEWSTASVYVQSSRWEILPIAILEAMAVGLPVVATDVGAVADVVVDGVTGRLVRSEDPTALASAIVELLSDKPKAARFASEARDLIQRLHTADRMAESVTSIYRGLL